MNSKPYALVISSILLLAGACAFAEAGTRSVETEVFISAGPDEVMQAWFQEGY